MIAPTVTITGPSLRSISDEALLALILRDDLPCFLMTMYTSEVDRRLQQHQPTGQLEMELAI